MLQRIQTIYFILVLASLGLTFLFPYAEFNGQYMLDNSGAFLLDRSQSVQTLLPFPLGYVVVGLIGLVMFTTLQYKNRTTQLKLGKLGYVLILGLVVLVYMSIDKVQAEIEAPAVTIEYLWSTYLPVVALVFLFLANRGIKKDEELVRSLDRLR